MKSHRSDGSRGWRVSPWGWKVGQGGGEWFQGVESHRSIIVRFERHVVITLLSLAAICG